MRVRTELSERPPEYSVTNDKGTARIRFYTDVQEAERDEGTVFTADMWEMSCPWQPTLTERIARNPELWLAKIKAVTREEEAREKLERLKETAADTAICELADIVAELMEAVAELAEMIA